MELIALEAHEIDKARITEAVALAVHDGAGQLVSQESESPMKPGDYYLRPFTVFKSVPASFFRRTFFRKKAKLAIETRHSVVISCPVCGMLIMTSSVHRIASKSPLTIENPVACPYAAPGSKDSHSFTIKAGKIQLMNA